MSPPAPRSLLPCLLAPAKGHHAAQPQQHHTPCVRHTQPRVDRPHVLPIPPGLRTTLPPCPHKPCCNPNTPSPSYHFPHRHLHTKTPTPPYIPPHSPNPHLLKHLHITTPSYPMHPPMPLMATRLAPQQAHPYHPHMSPLTLMSPPVPRSLLPYLSLRRRVVVLHNHSSTTRLASETRSQGWATCPADAPWPAYRSALPAPNQYPQPHIHPPPTTPLIPTYKIPPHLHTKTPTPLYI
jgi:hypothetical protein